MLLVVVAVCCHGASGLEAGELLGVIGLRRGGVTLVCEDVRKENLALIARTAETLGVGSIYAISSQRMGAHLRGFGDLSDETKAAQLSKISRSASDWVSLRHFDSPEQCVEALRRDGFDTLVATTPPRPGTVDVYDEVAGDWTSKRPALLFGSESQGLSPALLEAADICVSVPQRGMTQSLNVAACAALVLGETLRRRDKAKIVDTLAEHEQQRLIDVLSQPLRLHNKAHIKQHRFTYRKAFKAESDFERHNF